MRLIRLAFSIRALMILVALVGFGIGGWKLWTRSRYFAAEAEDCAMSKELAGSFCGNGIPEDPAKRKKAIDALEAYSRPKRDYYEALEKKYRAAARRPWLSVEPDPPST